jgi:hypothetical protein
VGHLGAECLVAAADRFVTKSIATIAFRQRPVRKFVETSGGAHMRSLNPVMKLKRRLTVFFIVAGGVFVPLLQDSATKALQPEDGNGAVWSAEAAGIALVAVLFLSVFGSAHGLLGFALKRWRRFRQWVYGDLWIEGEWQDRVRPGGPKSPASIKILYDEDGEIEVSGAVYDGDELLYKFDSLKAAMGKTALQFMYKSRVSGSASEVFGFACFDFDPKKGGPTDYIGYFVETTGSGPVEVKGRKVRPGRTGMVTAEPLPAHAETQGGMISASQSPPRTVPCDVKQPQPSQSPQA